MDAALPNRDLLVLEHSLEVGQRVQQRFRRHAVDTLQHVVGAMLQTALLVACPLRSLRR